MEYCKYRGPGLPPGRSRFGPQPSYILERMYKSYDYTEFDERLIRRALYRPFFKRYVYFDTGIFINRSHEIPSLFPRGDVTNGHPRVAGRILSLW